MQVDRTCQWYAELSTMHSDVPIRTLTAATDAGSAAPLAQTMAPEHVRGFLFRA